MNANINLAIVLCTYNGESFLNEQLDSFSAQSFKNWHLYVYDDQSTDKTKTIIDDYAQKHKVTFVSNEIKQGFSKNFLNGIKITPNDFNFYALSDQDDIWLEAKLERAISYLTNIESHIPALYCSRTTLIDSIRNKIGLSPLFKRKPTFNNALVQSIAGGNTMVFNKAAHALITKTSQDLKVISHDWFIYQLISGAGGIVYYDTHPEILYRQHANNLIGANNNLIARISRIKMLLNGSFKSWNEINLTGLKSNSDLLAKKNQIILDDFIECRKKSLISRILGFIKCGIYRQTFLGNIALYVGGIFNKI